MAIFLASLRSCTSSLCTQMHRNIKLGPSHVRNWKHSPHLAHWDLSAPGAHFHLRLCGADTIQSSLLGAVGKEDEEEGTRRGGLVNSVTKSKPKSHVVSQGPKVSKARKRRTSSSSSFLCFLALWQSTARAEEREAHIASRALLR